MPAAATDVDSFHGFHIHANDDPANGVGCQADPAAEPSEWFVSADGHLKQDGQLHGGHDGDMAPLFLDSNGRAEATFTIDRTDVHELDGRVVIVHAGPDNLGNVPVGSEPNEYTANSPDAVDRTQATGNAGDRIACGEITVSEPGRKRNADSSDDHQHPMDTRQRVPEGASREPPRRRLERHRYVSLADRDDAVRHARTRLLATCRTFATIQMDRNFEGGSTNTSSAP